MYDKTDCDTIHDYHNDIANEVHVSYDNHEVIEVKLHIYSIIPTFQFIDYLQAYMMILINELVVSHLPREIDSMLACDAGQT